MKRTLTGWISLLGSLVVHTSVFLASPAEMAQPRLPAPPTLLRLSATPALAERKPEPPPPEPLAPPPAEPPKQRIPKAMRQRAPEPESEAPEPEPESEPEPEPEAPEPEAARGVEPPEQTSRAELTGETLVSNVGQGFTAPTGNGGSRQGAIRAGFRRRTSSSAVAPKAASRRQAPRVPSSLRAVPLSQLSKRPEPPSLTRALERNYPPQARSLGRVGGAKVRARIEADGAVRLAKVVSETAQGFGEACRKTLLSSKWSIPLDRRGKPASTWVTYQCRFRVRR